jgi:DNA-binding FrmR family transcriptional regulator
MSHTIAKKEKLLNRVRRIRGQIESVERALDSEEGCSIVLQRIAAARGAMNSLMSDVLEEHVKTAPSGMTCLRIALSRARSVSGSFRLIPVMLAPGT